MLWTADPSKFLKYFCSTVSGAWQELDTIRIELYSFKSRYLMNFKLLLLLIAIPLLAELSMFVIGLMGLVLINIIYFPISWLGEPFFVCNSEVGCYPGMYGRILMAVLILLLYICYMNVKKKKKLFESTK